MTRTTTTTMIMMRTTTTTMIMMTYGATCMCSSIVPFLLPKSDYNSVQVAGSFNDWQPEGLEQKEDGEWTATLKLGNGTHLYK